MSMKNRHIISKVNWKSNFDDRSKAFHLQGVLSDWSKNNMPKEAEKILSRICPSNQKWRIDTLNLNLGVIKYDELESSLSDAFRTQLEESLKNLILSSTRGADQIEIVKEGESNLELIAFYLLNGVMPWWFNAQDNNFEESLLFEIKRDPLSLSELLRKIAKKKEARQRLVWQSKEEILVKVVKVLEPFNSDRIIEYIDQIQSVQKKEKIVNTSSSDFNKQVWYWVLTHLLEERGTLFNKVAFIESTIRQMSRFYNLVYEELLQLLLSIQESFESKYIRSSHFFQALFILQEKDSFRRKSSKSDTDKKHKIQVINFLQGQEFEKIDDLIASFAYEKGDELKELFAQHFSSKEVLRFLKTETHSKIIELYNYESRSFVNAFIQRFDQIYFEDIWLEVSNYFIEHSNFEKAHFIKKILLSLSKKIGITFNELLIDITYSSSFERSITDAEIFELLHEQIDFWGLDRATEQLENKNFEYVRNWILRNEAQKLIQFLRATKNKGAHLLSIRAKEKVYKYLDIQQTIYQIDKLFDSNRNLLKTAYTSEKLHQVIIEFISANQRIEIEKLIHFVFDKLGLHPESILNLVDLNEVDPEIKDIIQKRSKRFVQNCPTQLEEAIHNQDKHEVLRLCKLIGQKSTFSIEHLDTKLKSLLVQFLIQEDYKTIWNDFEKYEILGFEKRDMESVFLKCLFENDLHFGDTRILWKQFNDALKFNFGIHSERIKEENIIDKEGNRNSKDQSQRLSSHHSKTKSQPKPLKKHIYQRGEELFSMVRKEAFDLKNLNRETYLFYFSNGFWPSAYINTIDTKETIAYLFNQCSEMALELIGKESNTQKIIDRVRAYFSYKDLLQAIRENSNSIEKRLELLGQFYSVISLIKVKDLSESVLKEWIYKQTFLSWKSKQWKFTDNLITELIWELVSKHGTSKKEILNALSKAKYALPYSLQITFNSLLKEPVIRKEISSPYFIEKQKVETKISNAGLVLIQVYIERLFDQLGFCKGSKFINSRLQRRAVHILQYLAVAQTKSKEEDLVLNKILCGLHPSEPIEQGIKIKDEEIEITESLINAMINFWEAIGSCSVDGFRGNWLVRDGLLSETDDRWQLTVEKRAYDLLIERSPFSFSIIKFPWMNKPLHVTWQY